MCLRHTWVPAAFVFVEQPCEWFYFVVANAFETLRDLIAAIYSHLLKKNTFRKMREATKVLQTSDLFFHMDASTISSSSRPFRIGITGACEQEHHKLTIRQEFGQCFLVLLRPPYIQIQGFYDTFNLKKSNFVMDCFDKLHAGLTSNEPSAVSG